MLDDGLQITVTPHTPGWVRLQVKGEIDISTAAPFGERLLDELDTADGVLLDFEALEFIDSSGLARLMTAIKRARGSNTPLKLVQPLGPQPRRLLELSGLLPLLAG